MVKWLQQIMFKIMHQLMNKIKFIKEYSTSPASKKPPWKVLFFGSDKFSLFTLKALTKKYRNGSLIKNLEVVTTVREKLNSVKHFSDKELLRVHNWPVELEKDKFDVGIVVSFGHLIPSSVINKFHFGMLNIHASLLPRWRGAAPIIYTLASGDQKTGVTVMEVAPGKFDVGKIISQESVPVNDHIRMPELFEILGLLGAKCLIKTLEELPAALLNATPQPINGITYAPKITSSFAQINWNTMTSLQIYNLDRALTGLHCLTTFWKKTPVKLVNVCLHKDAQLSSETISLRPFKPGSVTFDKQTQLLNVLCGDFKLVTVDKISVKNKKIMSASDFNNGYIKKEQPNCRYFE